MSVWLFSLDGYMGLTCAFHWQGPCVVGGIGGSGTRVVAAILRAAGVFMGANVNRSNDSAYMGRFIQRWLRVHLRGRDGRTTGDQDAEIVREFRACVMRHLEGIGPSAPIWGWKNPPNIFLLPFLYEQCRDMRFIHVVRDGRDMAFSKNQYDLRNYGDLVLRNDPALRLMNMAWRVAPKLVPTDPFRSIALWSRINLQASEFGQRVLEKQYLCVRFEDLCSEPENEIRRIFRFVGADQSCLGRARACVIPPFTIGRWREQDLKTVGKLCRIGSAGIEKFGYGDVLCSEAASL